MSTAVLDEVQRVPELLNIVHALIKSKERRRFVLTGSRPGRMGENVGAFARFLVASDETTRSYGALVGEERRSLSVADAHLAADRR